MRREGRQLRTLLVRGLLELAHLQGTHRSTEELTSLSVLVVQTMSLFLRHILATRVACCRLFFQGDLGILLQALDDDD